MIKVEKVEISTALPEEKIIQNIVDARKFSLSRISDLPDWREGKVATIVGGGPSLTKNLFKLRHEELTIACGSVHDYLVENRIYPKYCLICDPDPIMGNYLQNHTERTNYLIASQCDQKVFELLEYRNNYIWDCLGPTEFNQKMFEDGTNAIPGGCTVGTRAILCAIGMGYKKLKLYGMDSCLDEQDNHHSYKFSDPELENIGPITEVRLDPPSEKIFKLAGYMMAQVFDFQELLRIYGCSLQIEIVGDGILAEIMRLGRLKAEELSKKG